MRELDFMRVWCEYIKARDEEGFQFVHVNEWVERYVSSYGERRPMSLAWI